MAIDGRKLVNYLAHDISPSQVANALNITPARVTQLAQEPKILEAIEKRKKQLAEEGITDIADLKSIKRSLIGRMADLVEGTDSLSEAVNALEKIDRMTAQKLGQEDDSSGVRHIIMQVPVFLQQNITNQLTLDSRNRIVGIKGRSMAQMPTQGVLDILNGKRGKEEHDGSEATYQEAADYGELDLAALQV